MADCIFCKISEGKIPAEKVYENERVLAILDINPVAPGHTLVMTKEHYETLADLPPERMIELSTRAQEVAKGLLAASGAEGFNFLSNNHRCSGQAIPHVHLHIIPRRSQDGIKFNWQTTKYGDGEMATWAEKVKTALKK